MEYLPYKWAWAEAWKSQCSQPTENTLQLLELSFFSMIGSVSGKETGSLGHVCLEWCWGLLSGPTLCIPRSTSSSWFWPLNDLFGPLLKSRKTASKSNFQAQFRPCPLPTTSYCLLLGQTLAWLIALCFGSVFNPLKWLSCFWVLLYLFKFWFLYSYCCCVSHEQEMTQSVNSLCSFDCYPSLSLRK